MGKVKGKKINVVTLGCSKNVVDSEHVMAQLAAAGYDVVFDSNGTEARTVVVNTCGFIGDAKEESINTILGFVRAKEEGAIDRLFVIGCLSERYAEELRREIPEVDAYFGSGSSFLRMEKTRGLAIGSKERYELCPDVPTFIEQGYAIESGKYRGLATPQNIPAEARQYLESKFAEVCANPEYQKAVKSSGLMPQFQTGKAFSEIIGREGEQAKKILEASGLLK